MQNRRAATVTASAPLARIDGPLPKKTAPATGRVLEAGDLSAMFGLDMAPGEAPSPVRPKKKKKAKAMSR